MEIWELNRLSRSEIEKMQDELKNVSANLDSERQKLIEDKVSQRYSNENKLCCSDDTLRNCLYSSES